MGDQVYPGVYLTLLDPQLTVDYLTSRFTRIVTEYGAASAIEKGGIRVELLSNGQLSNNAVVKGIQLPFNDIRRVFKGRFIAKRPIVISDVDFGIQRSDNGLFENHNDNKFRMQLKEGQGFFKDKIKPFQLEFINTVLGGDIGMGQTIALVEEKQNLNTELLWKIPGFLRFFINEKLEGDVKGTQLHFMSTLESMQALYYLNGDEKFSKRGVRFITPKSTTTKPGRGLGVGGELIDVQDYMERLGYVPFTAFTKKLFDEVKIHVTWASECIFCGRHYVLKGISPDFYWIAGTCACKPEEASYSWPGESFFRLTLTSTFQRRHESYQQTGNEQYAPLSLLIKGLTPLYSSINEFQHSVFASEKIESQEQKRIMAAKFALGEIRSTILPIEEKEEGEKIKTKMLFLNVELWTPTTSLWSPDSIQSILKVKLIPKVLVKAQNPSLSDIEAHLSKSLEGKMQRIWVDGSDSVVELTMWTNERSAPSEKGSFYMIPQPTSGNMTALTSGQQAWRSFLRYRHCVSPRQIGRMTAFSTFAEGYITTLDEGQQACDMNMEIGRNWILEKMLCGDLENIHFGIELDYCKRRFSGVVLSAKVKLGHPARFNIKVFFAKNKDDTIHNKAHFDAYMWMGCKENSKYPNDLKERLFDIGPKEKQEHPAVDTVSKINISSQPIPEPLTDSTPSCGSSEIKMDVKSGGDEEMKTEVAENEERSHNEESGIFKTIMKCPFNYYGTDMRDFLLKASVPEVSHVPPLSSIHSPQSQDLKFREYLNESQTDAVCAMLTNYIHSTEGPPGCGKSYTCCIGVLELHYRDPQCGMIVCVAQTNLAAQVLMETLYDVMEKTGYSLIVRRMMSHNREERVNSDQEDRYIHSAIKAHETFKSDEKIQDIYQQIKNNARFVISETDLMYLETRKSDVLKLIFDKTDVLICTVGAANDYRLAGYCAGRETVQLKGIFLDEANLVTVGSTLSLLGLNPRKFWMLGDYNQLAACFNNRSAQMAGAHISWMQMLTATDYGKKISPMTKLAEQYRFPQSICEVVSAWCYGNRLKCSKSVLKRPSLPFGESFYTEFPELRTSHILRVTYDDDQGRDEKVEGSYRNDKECKIVELLIQKLTKANVPRNQITVLSMYQAQVQKLASVLGQKYPEIPICTSDCFEGRQASVVIVSMVRANHKNQIGFLREINRTNVGISRAMNYLLFISHEKTFIKSKIPDVKRLYDILDSCEVKVIKM